MSHLLDFDTDDMVSFYTKILFRKQECYTQIQFEFKFLLAMKYKSLSIFFSFFKKPKY